jgi:hypothetical protein
MKADVCVAIRCRSAHRRPPSPLELPLSTFGIHGFFLWIDVLAKPFGF